MVRGDSESKGEDPVVKTSSATTAVVSMALLLLHSSSSRGGIRALTAPNDTLQAHFRSITMTQSSPQQQEEDGNGTLLLPMLPSPRRRSDGSLGKNSAASWNQVGIAEQRVQV